MFNLRSILFILTPVCFLVWPGTLQASETQEQHIEIAADGGTLAGTLLWPVPHDPEKKPPGALIIAGSGPTDRNGNGPFGGADNLRQLAQGLQQCGIASLRFDKRGIGQSRFPFLAERDLRIDHFIDDVKQLARYVNEQSLFGELWLVGHSEGALIALAAQPHVKAQRVMLLAGSSQRYLDIISRQIDTSLSDANRVQLQKGIRQIRAGRWSHVQFGGQVGAILSPATWPFLATADALDPLRLAAQIEVPMTVIQGDTDLQIRVDDAHALTAAATAPTQVIIHGMNHMLKAQAGDKFAQSISYANPGIPLHPQLLAAMCPNGVAPPPVAASPGALSASERELVGAWGGRIKGLGIRIIIRLFDNGDQLGGVADSPDQNAAGLILSSVNKRGRRVTMSSAQVGFRFEGKLKQISSGQFIDGDFHQGGQSFKLTLIKM